MNSAGFSPCGVGCNQSLAPCTGSSETSRAALTPLRTCARIEGKAGTDRETVSAISEKDVDMCVRLCHQRLGHLNAKDLVELLNKSVIIINTSMSEAVQMHEWENECIINFEV